MVSDSLTSKDWLCRQADMLLRRCPFVPQGEPFVLAPNRFDNHIVQDRVRLLIKRYKLPFDSINVFLHANMREPGKAVHTVTYDQSKVKLGYGQELLSVDFGGTYTIRDKLHPGGPKRIKVAEQLPPVRSVSMYLNQAYLANELMGAIVAHEMAHLYLDAHGVQKLNATHTTEMERTTDVAAFVMGLGELYLRGCNLEKGIWQGSQYCTVNHLGYLSFSEMSFVHQYVLDQLFPPVSTPVSTPVETPDSRASGGFWHWFKSLW
jgi:hypothetical protein